MGDFSILSIIYKRLERLYKLEKYLKEKHRGREINLTYHAGWDLGYIQGKICELETLQDLIQENLDEY